MTQSRSGYVRSVSVIVIGAMTLVLLAGCKSGSSPYAAQSESTRSPIEAERLTMKAADLLNSSTLTPNKLKEAEQLLRDALAADLYHGPAHNDLGVIYLKQGNYYGAASEFEWARKLLPGHPDPRMNLALTLERAGRTDEAMQTYASALEVYPGHVPTLQAMTRLQLRRNKADENTADHLRTIAMEGETQQWREWAKKQLIESPAVRQ